MKILLGRVAVSKEFFVMALLGRELRIGWNISGIDEGDNYCHPRRQSLSFKMLWKSIAHGGAETILR